MKKLIIALAVSAMAFAAQADVIAAWNFWGATLQTATNWPKTATTENADVTVSSLSLGAGLNLGGTPNATNVAYLRGAGANADLAMAITSNDYISLTITPDAGKTVTITNLSFYAYRGTAPGTNAWFSSVDGFTDGEQLGGQNYVITSLQSGSPTLVNITGLNLTFSTATEFRMYMWANSGSSPNYIGDRDTNIDTIKFEGSVVPEPATVGMLGLGALVTLLIRRMKR